MKLINILLILVVVVIVVVLCKIEYSKLIKNSIKIIDLPDKFVIAGDYLVYDKRYENEVSDKFDEYKYTFKPNILFSSRILHPFKKSRKALMNLNKQTMITDLSNAILPFANIMMEITGYYCNYIVKSKVDNVNVAYDGDYIIIF